MRDLVISDSNIQTPIPPPPVLILQFPHREGTDEISLVFTEMDGETDLEAWGCFCAGSLLKLPVTATTEGGRETWLGGKKSLLPPFKMLQPSLRSR